MIWNINRHYYRQFGVPWNVDDIHEQLNNVPDDRIGELFDVGIGSQSFA